MLSLSSPRDNISLHNVQAYIQACYVKNMDRLLDDFKIPRKAYRIEKHVRTRVKTYPNGDKVITVFNNPLVIFYEDENIDYRNMDNSNSVEKIPLTEEEEELEKERIKLKRFKEVRTKMRDYVLSNNFTHFWTLTQDEKKISNGDRFDDILALDNLKKFLKKVRQQAKRKDINFKYLVIPERHKNGALHFHVLSENYPYELIDSGITFKKRPLYNCKEWVYGFSSISEIRDKEKIANYIIKYITKDLMGQDLGRGRKKYWCSKGLSLPKTEYFEEDICSKMEANWTSKDGCVSIYKIKGDEKHG